jgi:predicted DNA-binding transcriptional regulator AlpA
MDTPEAAIYLGMSESWLNKARGRGNGPRYIKIGKAVKYRVSDCDAYLEARIRNSTSEPIAA